MCSNEESGPVREKDLEGGWMTMGVASTGE
jgi:hypothetical protein